MTDLTQTATKTSWSLGGSNAIHLFLPILETGKSKTKGLADVVAGERSPPLRPHCLGLKTAAFCLIVTEGRELGGVVQKGAEPCAGLGREEGEAGESRAGISSPSPRCIPRGGQKGSRRGLDEGRGDCGSPALCWTESSLEPLHGARGEQNILNFLCLHTFLL